MSTSPAPEAPTYDDVVAAAEQIAGHAVITPLLESPLLNEKLGGRLLVKAECLQRSGAFKFRGAYNRISRLGDEQRKAAHHQCPVQSSAHFPLSGTRFRRGSPHSQGPEPGHYGTAVDYRAEYSNDGVVVKKLYG